MSLGETSRRGVGGSRPSRAWLLIPALGAIALAMAVFTWTAPASGQTSATVLLEGVPGSISSGDAAFEVTIRVQGVASPLANCGAGVTPPLYCGLGSYEWHLRYNASVVKLAANPSLSSDGGFIDSTGRIKSCIPLLPPAVEEATVRFGCTTLDTLPGPTIQPGPSGSGVLSRMSFEPVGSGSPGIQFVCAGLGDAWGSTITVNGAPACVSPITPTPGPGETPPPGATNTPVPPGPGQPTATPTPTGPVNTPTPLPTPLPGEREPVQLLSGCNLRAFQPHYDPGIDLIAIVVDIEGGNPRLWFQIAGSPAFDLYDFRSVERSTKTILGPADEAGFICLDADAIWNRPILS